MKELTHLDAEGKARMVDVSGKPQTQRTATAAGEATFKQACLTCHGTDLVEQQRLPRAGWLREVDKMIRWGARVPDADKDALVAFLSARHGTAPRQ